MGLINGPLAAGEYILLLVGWKVFRIVSDVRCWKPNSFARFCQIKWSC